jgi:hypothetical protein
MIDRGKFCAWMGGDKLPYISTSGQAQGPSPFTIIPCLISAPQSSLQVSPLRSNDIFPHTTHFSTTQKIPTKTLDKSCI